MFQKAYYTYQNVVSHNFYKNSIFVFATQKKEHEA